MYLIEAAKSLTAKLYAAKITTARMLVHQESRKVLSRRMHPEGGREVPFQLTVPNKTFAKQLRYLKISLFHILIQEAAGRVDI